MLELHAFFLGRVQGVGFRATVFREAKKLGLKGFVRNLDDGRVELVAQGSKENLDHLLQVIQATFQKHIEEKEVKFRTTFESCPEFQQI